MKTKCFKFALIVTSLFFLYNNIFAQTRPVTVTTVLVPPYSLYLDDYYSVGSNKLMATLLFTDYNEPSWDARLKIKIESNKILLETKPDFIPSTPITIYPGVPLTISGEDLTEYFNFDNLTISGISLAELSQNSKIYEGTYTFSIEVYDYTSNRLLSNTGYSSATITLGNTPEILLPENKEVIIPIAPQNISFQWQCNQADPLKTNYKLFLYEISDPEVDPAVAVLNNQALKIFESDEINLSSFNYGPDKPLLEKAKRYAYMVQAIDVDGKNKFKNNGFSEIKWFYYGYPENGHIDIIKPINGGAFTIREDKYFKWNAPNNLTPDQSLHYYFKIVTLNQGENPEDAIDNAPWYETTTSDFVSNNQMGVVVDKFFSSDDEFAWQVKAFTGEQEIAKSDVYKLSGPPYIEQFNAGNHKILVTATTNNDLNDLSGSGKVKISENGEMLDVNFSHLRIEMIGGELKLMSGQIFTELYNFPAIELSPNYLDNGKAFFHPDAIKIDKNNMQIRGVFKWDFPFAVNSSSQGIVTSKTDWINFNQYKLIGTIGLSDNNKFDLLDPINFTINLSASSTIRMWNNNEYVLDLNGEITVPQTIKCKDQSILSFPFYNAEQLFYIDNEELADEKRIELLNNTQFYMIPKIITIDLSDNKSPNNISGNNAWKGVYINNFNIKYNTNFDKTGQLILLNEIVQEINLGSNSNFKTG